MATTIARTETEPKTRTELQPSVRQGAEVGFAAMALAIKVAWVAIRLPYWLYLSWGRNSMNEERDAYNEYRSLTAPDAAQPGGSPAEILAFRERKYRLACRAAGEDGTATARGSLLTRDGLI